MSIFDSIFKFLFEKDSHEVIEANTEFSSAQLRWMAQIRNDTSSERILLEVQQFLVDRDFKVLLLIV